MTESSGNVEMAVLRAFIDHLGREDIGSGEKIAAVFELSVAHRVSALGRSLVSALGDTVATGPFAGMRYQPGVSEGCVIPKMLGCYEQELHEEMLRVAAESYDTVLNIGCAEGYYAVGLARLLPGALVHASDIDPKARERAAGNARQNGVEDRIRIAGEFAYGDFATYAGRRVFLICDIEGAEYELLDPAKAPALSSFDMVVELHPGAACSAEEFIARFAATHECRIRHFEGRDPSGFPALRALSPLDQILALMERLEPTPWAIMRAKSLNR